MELDNYCWHAGARAGIVTSDKFKYSTGITKFVIILTLNYERLDQSPGQAFYLGISNNEKVNWASIKKVLLNLQICLLDRLTLDLLRKLLVKSSGWSFAVVKQSHFLSLPQQAWHSCVDLYISWYNCFCCVASTGVIPKQHPTLSLHSLSEHQLYRVNSTQYTNPVLVHQFEY